MSANRNKIASRLHPIHSAQLGSQVILRSLQFEEDEHKAHCDRGQREV